MLFSFHTQRLLVAAAKAATIPAYLPTGANDERRRSDVRALAWRPMR